MNNSKNFSKCQIVQGYYAMKIMPSLFHICITDFCQLKCKHCYFGDMARIREMTVDEIQLATDKFFAIRNIFQDMNYTFSEPYLNISGGEPMMHSQLSSIIRLIAPRFKMVKFLTNGWSYDSNIVHLLDIYSSKLIYQVSLDGDRNIHDMIRGKGSFDRAIHTIQSVHKDFPHIPVQVSCNVNSLNINNVLSVCRIAKDMGASIIFFDRYVPYMQSDLRVVNKNQYNKYIADIAIAKNTLEDDTFQVFNDRSMQDGGHYTCRACIGNQICTANGDRYVCTRYQIKSGNWFDDSINELVDKSIKLYDKLMAMPEECISCKHANICRGGMRCLTYAVTGRTDIRDLHCYRYEKDI